MKTLATFALFIGFITVIHANEDRSKTGFRYPRTFKAYIANKYKDEKKVYTHPGINKPRFRVSAGNFPTKKKANPNTSKNRTYSTPNYARTNRKQVQRAGIFCRFVEERIADSDCLTNVDTRFRGKIPHHRSSKARFYNATKSNGQKKAKKKSTRKKRTFSNRGYGRK